MGFPKDFPGEKAIGCNKKDRKRKFVVVFHFCVSNSAQRGNKSNFSLFMAGEIAAENFLKCA